MTRGTPDRPPGIPLPADEELPAEIREVLENLPPLNIFRMLARLPKSFRPFMQLGGSLLGDERIDARVREIAILRVAHVTGAPYEWAQHVQLGRNVGVTDGEIDAIRSDDPAIVLGPEEALACRVADRALAGRSGRGPHQLRGDYRRQSAGSRRRANREQLYPL